MDNTGNMNSGLEMRPGRPEDRDELAEFLGRILKYPAGTFFIRPEVLDWKYFQPRSDWKGPRNWIIKDKGRIVAHVGAWPFRINTSRGSIDGWHPIDWAADPEFAGMGALLFRNLTRRVPVMLALGGTKDAQRVLPGLGFSAIGDADVYARLIRPWNVFQGMRPSARSIARVARNTVRSLGVRASARSWSAVPVDVFSEGDLKPLSGIPAGPVAFLETSAGKLNFALACPGGNCRGFTLTHGGKRAGYLILSRPDGETRIVDLRIRSHEPEDWAAAYSLALDLAREDHGCNEIMSFASTELAREALAANGFRRVGSRLVRVIDRGTVLKDLPTLQLQSITTDAFFVCVPSRPYYLT
jgi:hypothetical protein